MGHRVLVVEDETLMCQIVRETLEQHGYEVGAAEDVASAIDWLKANTADLVLLDVSMPVSTGWVVLDFIHQLPAPPSVVVMTGVPGTAPKHLESYVKRYLAKPFGGELLLEVCGQVTAEHEQRRRRIEAAERLLHTADPEERRRVQDELERLAFGEPDAGQH